MKKRVQAVLAVWMALTMTIGLMVSASAAGLVDTVKERNDISNKQQRSISEVRNADDIILVAHRGLGTEAPENTIPAFELAAQKGFQYVETDIHTTKDGVWVISHDSNLKRMTGYDGEIRNMTLREVQSHPVIHGSNADRYPGLVTPTLEDFLRTCQEKDLNPVIEIKVWGLKEPYQKILSLLDQYGLKERAIIISFYTQPLALIRQLDESVREQYLSNTMSRRVVLNAALLQNCGIDVLGYTMMLRPLETKTAKALGIETNAWTIDNPAIASMMIMLDLPQYLTTNTLMPNQNQAA